MYQVMLVEDDHVIRYVYSRMKEWGSHGFMIAQEASNGSQALEKLKENPVDLIVTDIRMPLMDGMELLKRLKTEYPEILVILISSYHEFEYAREGLRLGAADYLIKPLKEEELSTALKRAADILDGRKTNGMLGILYKICGKETVQDPILMKLGACLENQLDQNLTLEAVAFELNLNKDYLGKLIKNKTGQNFRSLYNQIKMEYAKTMIKEDNYRIYEISERLGYTSADYFTQLFKKNTGVTPAEYKKNGN